ncbi:MAG: hypothetical protein IIA49_09635 [Bacteroidetes bacterium]|nr:hypothetical protein [Bacteroidota bacterium]
MITETDKHKILEIAKKYKAERVFLFGSSIDDNEDARDIDIAVEGIPDSVYFKFCSELIFGLSKPVDVIDLKTKSRFNELIISEGIPIYG